MAASTKKDSPPPPPRKRLRIAVLFGGRSAEHEVSIASASSVIRALDPAKYDAVPIGISKDGRWLVGRHAQKMLSDTLKQGERVFLPPEPGASALVRYSDEGSAPAVGIDVVFPVLHGTYGEDGTLQGLLELANLPYVGAGVLASAVGMDKDVQKRLFEQAGLPVVPWIALPRSRWENHRQEVLEQVASRFQFPVFVKPATLGSSVGMTKAHGAEELPAALDLAAEFAQKILIERGVDAREIEVAVLGNEEPRASVPGEVIPHHEFYDYAAKYTEEGTQLVIPAPLNPRQTAKVQEYAVRAFQVIEGRGMARMDFFLERHTGRIYLNEINTIPGFTSISMYPRMWEASGLSYRELIDRLIELALEQHREKQRTKFSFEPPPGGAGVLGG
ncbi:MAG TPA: D-alanine--D-alanine ligase family protein [Candidatus Acidoferrales bacterium]|nr:D-alanine--D-alanine ligase family protein [Candidatus Acidoferrales bacterium]